MMQYLIAAKLKGETVTSTSQRAFDALETELKRRNIVINHPELDNDPPESESSAGDT